MTQGTRAGGPTANPSYPEIPGCRLTGIAGQGGMGTVYRAEQASPRRVVAIKVLSQAAASADSLAAFHREAETIARLEHPNILPVYGYGEAAGRPYLVLRYLGGGSVARRIRKGSIDLPTAARWVSAVAGALDFAHAHGLVHRDVKPSNILLDEAGNAYLTDFGIAAALAAAGGADTTGSAAYMSPEQASGLPADKRSDLYSLAVSLFEMLTGQQPYSAETPLGMIVRHINDPIPSARALNPSLPPAVDDLIQRGMAKEPAARPQSAGEFARLLQRAVDGPDTALPAGKTVVASPPTVVAHPAGPAAPAQHANRSLLWIGIALVALCLLGVLALGGGGVALALFGGPKGTPTPQPSSTSPPSPTPPVLTPTPEGRLLADDFTNPQSGFGIPQADAGGGIAYAQGALRFSVLKQGVEWFSTSGRVHAQDVKIDVDAQQTAGPALNEFGAVCRWQDDKNFTAFAISGGGQYKLWQKNNGAVLRLADWTDAPSLAGAASAPHHLTVTCSNSQVSLTVDGVLLAQADDPAPVPGDVALFAGLREAGKLVVDFKNVLVSKP